MSYSKMQSKEEKKQLSKNRDALIKQWEPIQSRVSTDAFRNNFDRIFRKKK